MGRDDALYSDAECVQVYQRRAFPSLAGVGGGGCGAAAVLVPHTPQTASPDGL